MKTAPAAITENSAILMRVFHYIEKRYHHPISLNDVAKRANRSPAYLTTMIKKQTGRSVLGWITARRMAEARKLLLLTDDSIDRIAETVGYTDAGTLIRRFTSTHKTTPHAWRKRERGLATI